MKKKIAALVAVAMIFGCVIGGTIAWLMDTSTTVTNTFTTSDVDIELTESTGANYKMVPGGKVAKDPYVTVTENSENCYLFVKIEGANASIVANTGEANMGTYSLGDYIVYAVDSGWTALENQPNVFYKVIDNANEKGNAETAKHYILAGDSYTETVGQTNVTVTWDNNQVATKPSVTKAMMAALNEANYPKLTFTAYAVQMDNLADTDVDDNTTADVADAWAIINGK